MKFSVLHNPVFIELYEASQESPELDRVIKNMSRHIKKGTYSTEKTVSSVNRYVVETAAIDLHKKKCPGVTKTPWFTLYPADIRLSVAEKVVSSWEKELKS